MSSFEDEFIQSNIDLLVFCARNAGYLAQKDSQFKALQNDVCVVPMNMEGVTRAVRPLRVQTPTPVIDFAPHDLVLVGGAALQIYSNAFGDAGIATLSEPIHDADFVWWPRVQIPPNFTELVKAEGLPFETADQYFMEADTKTNVEMYGITSYSPAIQKFAELTAEHLGALLIKYFTKIEKNIAAILQKHGKPAIFEDEKLKFNVNVKKIHTYKAGVFNLNCILESGDFQTTILELAIHDNCSSQVSRSLQDKYTDEMYMSESEPFEADNSINFIRGKQIPELDIVLPKIEKLFLQQWLVLQNRLKHYEVSKNAAILPKVQKHYTRMDYMYSILYMLYKSNVHAVEYKKAVEILRRHPNPRFVTFIDNSIFTNDYWLMACTHSDVKRCTKDIRKFWKLCKEGRILNKRLCDQLAPPPSFPRSSASHMPPLPPRPSASHMPPLPPSYRTPPQGSYNGRRTMRKSSY
jgi:hypothetical protein